MLHAGNTPHSHPRGAEISFLLYGAIEFGMIDENANGNKLVLANMVQNDTIHVPSGNSALETPGLCAHKTHPDQHEQRGNMAAKLAC